MTGCVAEKKKREKESKMILCNLKCSVSISWLMLLLYSQMPTFIYYSKLRVNTGARQNQPGFLLG